MKRIDVKILLLALTCATVLVIGVKFCTDKKDEPVIEEVTETSEEPETVTIEETEQPIVTSGITSTMQEFLQSDYVESETYDGWIIEDVNVRSLPNTDSEILGVLKFDDYIEYRILDDSWVQITYDDRIAYVCSEFIADIPCPYEVCDVPNNYFKSWMGVETITDETSKQYELKQAAYVGNYGIMMVAGRYCIALGTGWGASVGDYVDLVLENGNVIQAIVGDIKADIHTDSTNKITRANGCISEFIADKNSLPYSVKNYDGTGSGNISTVCPDWDCSIQNILIYDKNYFQ